MLPKASAKSDCQKKQHFNLEPPKSLLNNNNNAPTGCLALNVVFAIAVAFVFEFNIQPSKALSFRSIQIPSLVARGASVWLVCDYELSDVDSPLYSVKWYKNNDEFYRLLSPPDIGFGGSQPLVSSISNDNDDDQGDQGDNGVQQQQQTGRRQQATAAPATASTSSRKFFAQSGLNVVMSASNSTHVRLLNASLELEALFACEISTQNLSTIRFEKEIRVYVPAARPIQVGGLRAKYALGDTVDLTCASDFTRPAAKLAWLFNNSVVQAGSWPFELGSEKIERSPVDSNVSRTKLTLRFRLTRDLLPDFGALDNTKMTHFALHCKMRLADVSDVTLDELVVSQLQSAGSASQHLSASTPSGSSLSPPPSSQQQQHQHQNSATNKVVQIGRPLVSVAQLSKSLDGRVVLLHEDAPTVAGAQNACVGGALALAELDPLIVGAQPQPQPQHQHQHPSSQLTRPPTEASVGQRLRLECRTLGALPLNAPNNVCASSARRSLVASGGLGSLPAQQAPLVARVAFGASESAATKPRRAPPASGVVAQRGITDQRQQQDAQQPQPLLEWFVNDEQAASSEHQAAALPQSSSDTAPASSLDSADNMSEQPDFGPDEMLEVASPSSGGLLTASDNDGEPDDATTKITTRDALVPAPVDYAHYFGTLDALPVRRLGLNLTLQKHHFSSADGKLRLRCYSTQAQLLQTDSLSIAFVFGTANADTMPIPNNKPPTTGWSLEGGARNKQQQLLQSKLWSQGKPRTRHGGASGSSSQQKQSLEPRGSKKSSTNSAANQKTPNLNVHMLLVAALNQIMLGSLLLLLDVTFIYF